MEMDRWKWMDGWMIIECYYCTGRVILSKRYIFFGEITTKLQVS
jgi:hypothetical protein